MTGLAMARSRMLKSLVRCTAPENPGCVILTDVVFTVVTEAGI